MRKLLVTGGAGFIGSNFVHYWLREHPGDRVVVLDAITYAGNPANLNAVMRNTNLSFVHGNICDTHLVSRLLAEESIDTIVHFAAESHVDRSISGPDAFVETNIVGTHCLLKAARQVWLIDGKAPCHRFHHVSTDEVYGSLGPQDPPFTETTQYAPNSPYAASKAASDHLIRAYQHTYGLNTTISNCSNNYGPYHFPEKLIPLVIVNLLTGEPLPIYGKGINVRDWLHVHDHCRALDLILSRGASGQVYNVGGRSEAQNISLVKMLCQIANDAFAHSPELRIRFPRAVSVAGLDSTSSIRFVSDRPGHDLRYAIDAAKLERELGFVPLTRLEEGLVQTFKWYVDNESWWRGIIDGSYRDWLSVNYSSR